MIKHVVKIFGMTVVAMVVIGVAGVIYMVNVLRNPELIDVEPVAHTSQDFDKGRYFNEKSPSFHTISTLRSDKTDAAAAFHIVNLRTEKLDSPLGLDEAQPRFSWQINSRERNVRQLGYQLHVANNEATVWDSGWVESDQSHLVAYAGPELQPHTDYQWRVRLRLNGDHFPDSETGWSEPAHWQTGFMGDGWHAHWIDPELEINPDEMQPSPYLRKGFTLPELPVKARLYISAKGLYEAYMNGQRVGEMEFTPGFTAYKKRIQYQVYDVTSMLQTGENVIGAILGDGWYRGGIGLNGWRNVFGKKLALIAELHLTYADGHSQTVLTDSSWRASSDGPIRRADMMRGEHYDARLELKGWQMPSFDDSGWRPVSETAESTTLLIDTRSPLPKAIEIFTPRVLTTPQGETVLDFGQNMAGYVQFSVLGPQGHAVSLKFGETLDKDGNFTQDNVRQAVFEKDWQQVHYILNGGDREVYTPHFHVSGFRYALLENWPEAIDEKNFTAQAVYSDLEQTGFVETSSPMVNRFVLNSLWSQKSNFLDIPTDCPQRERAGWTGDAQAYYPTATLFMNVAPFFDKWLQDLAAFQYDDGKIPNMVPFLTMPVTDRDDFNLKILPYLEGAAGWGDASVIIPWQQYRHYGDKRVLAAQWPMMKAWVDYQARQAQKTELLRFYKRLGANAELEDYVWNTGFHWGEWLEPGKPMLLSLINQIFFGEPAVATAYFYHSSKLLSRTAQVLGKTEEAAYYRELAQKVAAAYRANFTADGMIESGWQADYVRPVGLGLLQGVEAKQVVADLAEKIKANHYRIGTGFLSTPMILGMLTDHGYHDVAWKMLNQPDAPGWMYAVNKGATTIWENWKAIEDDGSVSQSSLNHYAYGAASSWLFNKVAGIELADGAPAYQHFQFNPRPVADLDFTRAQIHSPYGLIESYWQKVPEGMRYRFSVPPNSAATVTLPIRHGASVTEQGRALEQIQGVSNIVYQNAAVQFELGSGVYRFAVSQ